MQVLGILCSADWDSIHFWMNEWICIYLSTWFYVLQSNAQILVKISCPMRYLHVVFSWRCRCCSPKVLAPIKVPNERDLFHDIAYQGDRKVQGSFVCVCLFDWQAEMVFLYQDGIIHHCFHYWLLFLILKVYRKLNAFKLNTANMFFHANDCLMRKALEFSLHSANL